MSAAVVAYMPHEDVGMIVAAYVLVAATAGALVWRVLRRGKLLTRRVPKEEWPWT
jgi:hypothetical protein